MEKERVTEKDMGLQHRCPGESYTINDSVCRGAKGKLP